MKIKILILLLLFIPLHSIAQKNIEVKINKNVEFLSMLGWLIFIGEKYENGQEYINWNNQKFQIDAYKRFKRFANSKNIETLKKTYENEGFDSYLYLFSQLDNFPNCKLKNEIDSKYYLYLNDSMTISEAKENTIIIIYDLNKLYVETQFEKFWKKNKNLYKNAIKEVKHNLPNKRFINEMERFYNNKTYTGYILNPSLLIPSGWGFGPNINNNVYNFFGSFNGLNLEEKSTGFNDKTELIELSTHEYGHSFVNPIIDSINQELIKSKDYLFEPIRKDMKSQGYSNWKTCLYEHFVRAGEIIIAENLGDNKTSERLQKDYIENRKFINIPLILEKYKIYSKMENKNFKETVEQIIIEMK